MVPRLTDIVEVTARLRELLVAMPLEAFRADWQTQWLVERGVEIISEASRHLSQDMKDRHREIPWKKVAGIGNILRHDYGNVAAPVLWALVHENLPLLDRVCREELAAVREGESPDRCHAATQAAATKEAAARSRCMTQTETDPPHVERTSPLPPAPVPPGGNAALPAGSLPKPFLGPQGDEHRDPSPNAPAPTGPAPTVKDDEPKR